MGVQTERAYHLTAELLSTDLPHRWAHCVGVYRRSLDLASRWLSSEHLVDTLTASAIAHDIGYADELTRSGHHAVDGARYLKQCGFGDQVVSLVAWHSTAEWEVPQLGIDLNDEASPPQKRVLRDLLWVADFTTSPDGRPMSPSTRIADIRDRYAPDSTPIRALDDSAADFDAVLARFGVSWMVEPGDA